MTADWTRAMAVEVVKNDCSLLMNWRKGGGERLIKGDGI